jgi:hypothetical protein
MSDMDKDIDFDIIESYKKPITIPARHILTRFLIKGSTLIIYKT